MKEHKRALCSLDVNTSAVAEHCIKKNHCIDGKSARVLKKREQITPEMLSGVLAHKRTECIHEQRQWYIATGV